MAGASVAGHHYQDFRIDGGNNILGAYYAGECYEQSDLKVFKISADILLKLRRHYGRDTKRICASSSKGRRTLERTEKSI